MYFSVVIYHKKYFFSDLYFLAFPLLKVKLNNQMEETDIKNTTLTITWSSFDGGKHMLGLYERIYVIFIFNFLRFIFLSFLHQITILSMDNDTNIMLNYSN
jgi:hypothetical protein